MQVNKTNADSLRIETGSVKPHAAPAAPASSTEPVTPVRRADEVEISVAGRVLVADLPADSAVIAELGMDRVAHLRAKVASGVYLTSEAASDAARGILRSGDL